MYSCNPATMRFKGTHRVMIALALTGFLFQARFLILPLSQHRVTELTAPVTEAEDCGSNQSYYYKPIQEKSATDQRRYLLPLGVIGGGPNYAYKHIKVAARFAIHLNRTMVLTPIFRHRSRVLVPFQDTFDIAQFAKITQTAELKEFKRECGSMVKMVLMGPHTRQDLFSEMSRNYKKLKKKYLAKFGITLPSDATVPSTDEDARERLESSANETCVGVFISYSYVHQSTLLNGMGLPMNATADIATSVDRHLKRVPTITSVADAVKDSICEGKPYLALHWRNKTGEQCSSKRKTSLINPVNCRKFLSSLTKAGDKFASDVSDIMSIHNLSCIYVAYLPYSKEIIDMLSRRIEDISTAADILEAADTSSVSAVLTDEYMFSLVEQEICYRAEVFIGSMWSNWANFVASEFESEDRPVYYLLGVRGSLVEPVANITISRDSDGVPRP